MQHVADGIADALNEVLSEKWADLRGTKGERLHSLSLFSCPANSPKTAEPLPDIEA